MYIAKVPNRNSPPAILIRESGAPKTRTVANISKWKPARIEALRQLAQAMTIKAMYAEIDVAPGAGSSFQYTLRRNGADTGLLCTISGTATTCNAALNVAIADDDLLALEQTPSNSPAQFQSVHVSFTAAKTPTLPTSRPSPSTGQRSMTRFVARRLRITPCSIA